MLCFYIGMQWINGYRNAIGSIQAMTPNPAGSAANAPSSAFAGILAARIGEAAHLSGNGSPLSPETVKMLAMILSRHLDSEFATGTASWLDRYATSGRFAPLPQATTPQASIPEPAGHTEPAPQAEPIAQTKTTSHTTPHKEATATPPRDISQLIEQAASRYRLDPSLISSVIETESSFDTKAVSHAGAQGLMQLMPETARELKVDNPFDPAQNIDGGSRYLANLMDRYHGDAKLALAAYNWGMGNLERQPEKMPVETKNYVANVMKRWEQKRTDVA